MFATPRVSMFATPRVPVGGSGSNNVKVFVRTRPLLPAEYDEGVHSIIHASSADNQVIIEDGSGKSFQYDGVLEENAGQEEVYMKAVAPLVARVKEGCNATVLAYGQTGSGKTYTMGTSSCISEVNDAGVLQRALQEFFRVDENYPPSVDKYIKPYSPSSYQLKLSMVEIYSETVYDLLASRNELKIKSEIGGGASIVGLVEEHIDTPEKGFALLEKGTHYRSIGTTAMNSSSSRSHALVFLTVKHGNCEGCLKLVDLAGAEGVGRAQTSGLQFTEGVNINKGLLSLGKVLAALSSSSVHVPYRESLLTRVLKDSLCGGSYTCMIACVNPSSNNLHETINTLRYAEQTRNIKMKVQALSTIKRREGKRRLEDVSANSGAWKKRAVLTEKAEHNSTISTPGHKPPVRKLAPLLNNTVATPCRRISGVLPLHEQKHTLEMGKSLFLPPPPPHRPLPSLAKNIFEDDSPSGLSTMSVIEETKASPSGDSLFMDRITSHLEATMVAQLENIEDRVADTIIAKLTQTKKGKQARKTKQIMGKSMCSTPTDDSSSGTDTESSCDNILEKTIAQVFLRKNKMKNILEEAVSSALGRLTVVSSEASNMNATCGTEAKPLPSKMTTDYRHYQELTDISHSQETSYVKDCRKDRQIQSSLKFIHTPGVHTIQECKMEELPITSTAVCEKRRARRSTRIATRVSLHQAAFNQVSPERKFSPEVTIYMNESGSPLVMGDVTTIQANATVIQANNDSPALESYSSGKSTECETGEGLTDHNVTTINTKQEKAYRRRSSRLEARTGHNIITINTDKQNAKQEKNSRRRSSRLEGLKATEKNRMIFQDQSPILSTNKKRRSCSTKAALLNRSVVSSPVMTSQRLQEEHNDDILSIINSGSLKQLQQLPTIGPKTAMVICNYRKLYGKLHNIKELEKVPGISKNFYSRFTKVNLVTEVLQQP